MRIETFELERRQSIWENHVSFNLTESGIHPYTLHELFREEEREELLNLRLGYGQTNGSVELRKVIASLYEDQEQSNILVTSGSSEANFIAMHTLLEEGDEIVYMVPNYLQIWGLARSMKATVNTFRLLEELNWQPDIQELEGLITEKTKMIIVCNPNNPTGSVLNRESIDAIIGLAGEIDAYIYADEVYRGAELSGKETESFLNLYDKAIVCGGLSKSYALPGVRIGWLAGPDDIIEKCWSHRDYTSISSSVLSQEIAVRALQPGKRSDILDRNRNILRENLKVIQDWQDQVNMFEFIPPKAGGMAFFKYQMDINSTELTNQLRKDKSVFLVAGDCFGMDHYLRIGFGAEKNYLNDGLNLFSDFLNDLSR
jgi:aspartate/methionine/tyrosine aminotransferase